MTVVRPMALLLTTLLALSGCSLLQQKPVPLYQLDSGQAVTPTKDNGVTVLVGPISVADYLRQQNLLQRQANWRSICWSISLARPLAQRASCAATRLPSATAASKAAL